MKEDYSLVVFVIYQVLFIIVIIVSVYFLILSITSHFIEIPWWKLEDPTTLMIVSIFGAVGFILCEIILFRRFRKYGVAGTFNIASWSPIWREPDLLIKLRDPRVSMRKKCLLKIMHSWSELQQEEKFKADRFFVEDAYLKRISFCLIDRNPEIRRLACVILHENFGKTVEDMEDRLRYCFYVNFYLTDKNLKKTYEEDGLGGLDLCKDII